MAVAHRLRGDERGFLERVARFSYSNPFDPDSAALLDTLVPGGPGRTSQTDVHGLARAVAARFERFDGPAPARIDDFATGDRPLVEAGYLYVTYHGFIEDFDRLIATQMLQAERVAVAFHDALFGRLLERGFDTERAALYVAFFHQLRRAFHFILRSLPGESAGMSELRRALWNNVFTHDMGVYARRIWNRMEDFSTLLLGETGTGKGSAAAAIGQSGFIPYDAASRRFAESFTSTFTSLNLSQFPESLIESELFGHRKGAFTGAIDHHTGVFARCSRHGALFLDEIGEASVPIQIKLLQVLQERTFTPLGGRGAERFSGRVIAATNRALVELRGAGGLRDDFFYRLCSDAIVVPTLRSRLAERPEELDELVRVIIERTLGTPDADLAATVRDALRREVPAGYRWPGNVRELEQAVRGVLLTGHYHAAVRGFVHDREEAFVSDVRAGTLAAADLVERYCAMLYERNPVYATVAAVTGLDRRTVRKHVVAARRRST